MDGTFHAISAAVSSENHPLRSFAIRVVSELARSAGSRGDTHARMPRKVVDDLVMRFARNGDLRALEDLHGEMRRRQVSAEDITDIYLPRAITTIGTAWHGDEMDVLSASIAFGRLQTLLRELGRAWNSDAIGRATDARVLLMLPEGEQHTLGAMLAVYHLRRIGVSVKVELSPAVAVMQEHISRNQFHAVFVSVSNVSAITSCEQLIRDVRRCCSAPIPVVLGGGLVSAAIADNDLRRIAEMTGADVVTNDIGVALGSCSIQQFKVAAE